MKKLREIKIFSNDIDEGYVQVALDYRIAIGDESIKELSNKDASEIVKSGKELIEYFETISSDEFKKVTNIFENYGIKYNFKNI